MNKCWVPILLVLAPSAPESVELTWLPKDGESTSLVFERVLHLELESSDQKIRYDGEDQDGEPPPEIEFEMTETESISFTDRYQVRDGRLSAIERTFDKISNLYETKLTDPEGEEFLDENQGTSELEDGTVWFRWNAESEEFDAGFGEASTELDAELLEGLESSANLSGFLPDESVEVGDTWEPPIAAFIGMTNLSGDLKVVPEGDEEQDESSDYGQQFDDHLSGELEAEFTEIREADGARLAVIRLHMELSTVIEIEHEVDAEGATGTEAEEHAFEFEVEGELLWDLGAQRARSFELAGDITMRIEALKSYSFSGHEMVIEESQDFAGTLRFAATIE